MLDQHRSVQPYHVKPRDDEALLTEAINSLAMQFNPYGYRRITALLKSNGWPVNHKRGRLWLNDAHVFGNRRNIKSHAWAYDFVVVRIHEGKRFRMLTVINEHSRECLEIKAARNLNPHDVTDVLCNLFMHHGEPDYIRSDNGVDFTAKIVRTWLKALKVNILLIETGRPWGNSYNESFNEKLRDELLNGEIFYTLKEAQILIEE